MLTFDKKVQTLGARFQPTFLHGTCGPSAYAEAARVLVETEEPVDFVVSVHPIADVDAGKVIAVYRFQRCGWDGGESRIRWCGERGEPRGAGSHSLHCYDVTSPAEVAAALAESLTGLACKVKGGIVTMMA